MHIWIAFDARDPLGDKFTHIKEYLGVSSKAEVPRSETGKAELAALYEMYRNLIGILHSPLKEIAERGEVPRTQRGDEYVNNNG